MLASSPWALGSLFPCVRPNSVLFLTELARHSVFNHYEPEVRLVPPRQIRAHLVVCSVSIVCSGVRTSLLDVIPFYLHVNLWGRCYHCFPSFKAGPTAFCPHSSGSKSLTKEDRLLSKYCLPDKFLYFLLGGRSLLMVKRNRIINPP